MSVGQRDVQSLGDVAGYDFLDLGSSRGNSIKYGMRRFGGTHGLGVDLNATKVDEARAQGLDVVTADATRLSVENGVRFVQMMDFLEHLADLETVEQVISRAAAAATDFLFIFHPSFEGEEYLHTLGFRLYWWHWRTHTAHIRVSDYCQMFDRLGLRQYMIRYVGPIDDSNHRFVLLVDEPADQTEWRPDLHAPKPTVAFEHRLWRAQEIFVPLRPFAEKEWAWVTRPKGQGHWGGGG